MKRGDKGEFVAILQKTLAELGYDPGPVDGKYGPKTEAAVKKYQHDLLTHPKVRGMIHGGSGDFAMALESDPSSGYTLTASGEVDDTLWMALTKHHALMVDFITPADTTGDDTTPADTTGDDTTPADTTGDDTTPADTTGDDTTGDDGTGDDGTGDDGTGLNLDGTHPADGPWGTVEALQEALAAAGFNPGPIDGITGPLTQAAMEAFNVSIGGSGIAISADGWATLLGTRPGEGDTGGGEPPPESLTDDEIQRYAAEFGYGVSFLTHPELGPLLRQAAEEGWDFGKFEGALYGTQWYKDYEDAERAFQLIESTDPASAAARLEDSATLVQLEAGRLGITIGTTRANVLARTAIVNNWSDYDIATAVLGEAMWDPGEAETGAIAGNMRQINGLVSNYMVSYSAATLEDFARKLYLGEETIAGLEAEFANQAKSMFPTLATKIDQGYTVAQVFDPYAQQVSKMLDIPATEIDFANDPRFQSIIDHIGTDGEHRPMTLSEVGNYVRTLDDWQITDQAKSEARGFADFIGRKFGKAA